MLLLALPLIISCGERTATDPVATGSSASTTASSTKAVFIVEPTPMTVPTYDGSGQAVHPDIVAFDAAWHGARYWLTMTPYPKSDQTLENPSVLTSDDGVNVAVPAGVQNPVISPPRRSKDYNSDPELVYEAQTKRLVLFHRLVDKQANTVHVSTSLDGRTWKATPAPFWERRHRVVSPTVAPRTGAAARMWYVNAGKAGCDAESTTVMTRRASDLTGRVVETHWVSPVATDLAIPGYVIWHIKARWIASKSEYWMLISAFPEHGNGCHTDDLFFARSIDGLHWTAYSEPIMRHEERDWTAAAVYRSTFLYDEATDELNLWISARGSDGAWRLGYARTRYALLLSALEADKPLSRRQAIIFPAPALQPGDQP